MVVSMKPKGEGEKKKAYMQAETMVAEGSAGSDQETVVQHESEVVDMGDKMPTSNGLDAEIDFSLGAVIPTGEFANIRVHVGAKVACEADTDVMNSTFDVVKDWVDNKISEVIAEIQTS